MTKSLVDLGDPGGAGPRRGAGHSQPLGLRVEPQRLAVRLNKGHH